MQIEIELVKSEFVKVDLPLFFKSDSGICYGIINNKLGVSVHPDGVSTTTYIDIYAKYYKPESVITEKEFKETIELVKEKLNNLFNQQL